MFALYRIAGAPPPRRRNQAGRRVIEAKYVLVKDAGMGGYQEVAMRVNDLPVELICVSLLIENCADIGNDRAPGPVWDFEGWCSGALALEILPAPWRVAPRGAIEDLHEGLHDIRIVEGYR